MNKYYDNSYNPYYSIEGYGKRESSLLSEPVRIYAPNNIWTMGRYFRFLLGGNIIVPESFVLTIDNSLAPIGGNIRHHIDDAKRHSIEFINTKPIIFNDLERDLGYDELDLQNHFEFWPFLMANATAVRVNIENYAITDYVFTIAYKYVIDKEEGVVIGNIPFVWQNN